MVLDDKPVIFQAKIVRKSEPYVQMYIYIHKKKTLEETSACDCAYMRAKWLVLLDYKPNGPSSAHYMNSVLAITKAIGMRQLVQVFLESTAAPENTGKSLKWFPFSLELSDQCRINKRPKGGFDAVILVPVWVGLLEKRALYLL